MKIKLLVTSLMLVSPLISCPTCIGRITAQTPAFFSPEADAHLGISAHEETVLEQEVALEKNNSPEMEVV